MRLRTTLKTALLLTLAAGLLPACRSSRPAGGKPSTTAVSDLEHVERVIAQAPQATCVNAKMRFSLQLGNKDFSIGGNFRMKKDDVIQLSLVGFGIIEGGRIEFTRDSVLLLDRIHHQYVSVAYRDVRFLREAQVDFYTLQALFWNELVLPGLPHVTQAEASGFEVTHEQGDAVLAARQRNRRLAYRFVTSLVTGLLEQTSISSGSGYTLKWSYGDFVDLAGAKYPSFQKVELSGLRVPAVMTISLNRIATDDGWATRTQVSKRYQRISGDEFIKMLMQMQSLGL